MKYSPSADLRRYTLRNTQKKNGFLDYFSGISAVKLLIGLNILLFLVFSFLGVLSNEDCSKTFCKFIALNPTNLFQNSYWWTLITSMFMHSGFMHILVNMISLYFVGNFLELLIGKKRFIGFYLIAGLFAGIFYALLSFAFGNNPLGASIFGAANGFALGASGAIFGVAGVLCVLTPKNKVYLIAGPLIAIILEYILIGVFNFNSVLVGFLDILIFAYILISVFSFFPFNSRFKNIAFPIAMPFWLLPFAAIIPLVILGIFVSLPIGNMAHLGGLLAGIIYGFYLRLRYKKKTEMISRMFSK